MKNYIYRQRSEILVLLNILILLIIGAVVAYITYLNWNAFDLNALITLIFGFSLIVFGSGVLYFQVFNILMFHNTEELKLIPLTFMNRLDDNYIEFKIPKIFSFKKFILIKISDVLEYTTEDENHYKQYNVIESDKIDAIFVLKDGSEVSFIDNEFKGKNIDKIDYFISSYSKSLKHPTHTQFSNIDYNEVAFKINTSNLEQFPIKSVKIRKKGKPVIANIDFIH